MKHELHAIAYFGCKSARILHMKSLNRLQLSAIAAASVLLAYVGVASSMQPTNQANELDLSAILQTADAAAVDYFLKIDGVEGESTDDRHKGEIEILSFSWGESNMGTKVRGCGAGAGKVSMQDFHFTMAINKASPKLFLMCATGEHIKEATLMVRKAGTEAPVEYLKIKLSDVVVSSYQTGGSGDVPMDSFSLNFSKIEFEYKPQKPDGSLDAPIKAGYDLKLNKKV
jgi:type VI secretion system secreted protein Hcp